MSDMLTISIDSTSVQQIVAAGQYVTVLQSVQSYVQSAFATAFATTAGQPLAIAWLTFRPFPTTVITWPPNYALYASPAAPASGVQVRPAAAQNASEFQSYPFQNNTFGTPASTSTAGYSVHNLQGRAMTFGLALSATINQEPLPVTPINASTLLNNQVGQFTPAAAVAVFLSTISSSGTAFAPFGEPVYYAVRNGSVSLQYQASNSTFVPTTS